MALVLRKNDEGTVLEGDPPKEHTFAARFIEREIASGLATVRLTLNLRGGETAEYEMDGFEINEPDEDGNVITNLSGWRMSRVKGDQHV